MGSTWTKFKNDFSELTQQQNLHFYKLGAEHAYKESQRASVEALKTGTQQLLTIMLALKLLISQHRHSFVELVIKKTQFIYQLNDHKQIIFQAKLNISSQISLFQIVFKRFIIIAAGSPCASHSLSHVVSQECHKNNIYTAMSQYSINRNIRVIFRVQI